jgi:hypothetical protein
MLCAEYLHKRGGGASWPRGVDPLVLRGVKMVCVAANEDTFAILVLDVSCGD